MSKHCSKLKRSGEKKNVFKVLKRNNNSKSWIIIKKGQISASSSLYFVDNTKVIDPVCPKQLIDISKQSHTVFINKIKVGKNEFKITNSEINRGKDSMKNQNATHSPLKQNGNFSFFISPNGSWQIKESVYSSNYSSDITGIIEIVKHKYDKTTSNYNCWVKHKSMAKPKEQMKLMNSSQHTVNMNKNDDVVSSTVNFDSPETSSKYSFSQRVGVSDCQGGVKYSKSDSRKRSHSLSPSQGMITKFKFGDCNVGLESNKYFYDFGEHEKEYESESSISTLYSGKSVNVQLEKDQRISKKEHKEKREKRKKIKRKSNERESDSGSVMCSPSLKKQKYDKIISKNLITLGQISSSRNFTLDEDRQYTHPKKSKGHIFNSQLETNQENSVEREKSLENTSKISRFSPEPECDEVVEEDLFVSTQEADEHSSTKSLKTGGKNTNDPPVLNSETDNSITPTITKQQNKEEISKDHKAYFSETLGSNVAHESTKPSSDSHSKRKILSSIKKTPTKCQNLAEDSVDITSYINKIKESCLENREEKLDSSNLLLPPSDNSKSGLVEKKKHKHSNSLNKGSSVHDVNLSDIPESETAMSEENPTPIKSKNKNKKEKLKNDHNRFLFVGESSLSTDSPRLTKSSLISDDSDETNVDLELSRTQKKHSETFKEIQDANVDDTSLFLSPLDILKSDRTKKKSCTNSNSFSKGSPARDHNPADIPRSETSMSEENSTTKKSKKDKSQKKSTESFQDSRDENVDGTNLLLSPLDILKSYQKSHKNSNSFSKVNPAHDHNPADIPESETSMSEENSRPKKRKKEKSQKKSTESFQDSRDENVDGTNLFLSPLDILKSYRKSHKNSNSFSKVNPAHDHKPADIPESETSMSEENSTPKKRKKEKSQKKSTESFQDSRDENVDGTNLFLSPLDILKSYRKSHKNSNSFSKVNPAHDHKPADIPESETSMSEENSTPKKRKKEKSQKKSTESFQDNRDENVDGTNLFLSPLDILKSYRKSHKNSNSFSKRSPAHDHNPADISESETSMSEENSTTKKRKKEKSQKKSTESFQDSRDENVDGTNLFLSPLDILKSGRKSHKNSNSFSKVNPAHDHKPADISESETSMSEKNSTAKKSKKIKSQKKSTESFPDSRDENVDGTNLFLSPLDILKSGRKSHKNSNSFSKVNPAHDDNPADIPESETSMSEESSIPKKSKQKIKKEKLRNNNNKGFRELSLSRDSPDITKICLISGDSNEVNVDLDFPNSQKKLFQENRDEIVNETNVTSSQSDILKPDCLEEENHKHSNSLSKGSPIHDDNPADIPESEISMSEESSTPKKSKQKIKKEKLKNNSNKGFRESSLSRDSPDLTKICLISGDSNEVNVDLNFPNSQKKLFQENRDEIVNETNVTSSQSDILKPDCLEKENHKHSNSISKGSPIHNDNSVNIPESDTSMSEENSTPEKNKQKSKKEKIKNNNNKCFGESPFCKDSPRLSKISFPESQKKVKHSKPVLASSTPHPQKKKKRISSERDESFRSSLTSSALNSSMADSGLESEDRVLDDVQCQLIASEDELNKLTNLSIYIDWELSPLHEVDNGSQKISFKTLEDKLGAKHLDLLDKSKFLAKEEEQIRKNWEEFSQIYCRSECLCEMVYKCVICGSEFCRKAALYGHIFIHATEKPFPCPVCDKAFAQLEAMKTHLLIHTGEKPFKCTLCGSEFKHRHSMRTHILTHSGKKPYKCAECGISFYRRNALERHLFSHNKEKPFKCNFCEMTFARPTNLKRHTIIHTGKKPFKCTICQVEFNRKDHLTRHNLIHSGEKRYTCSICETKFAHGSSLKIHLYTHTGEKPIQCAICEARFTNRSSLKTHLKTHSKEKPYECPICKTSITSYSGLKVHILTHTGEKPYQCSICGVRFIQSNGLRRHMLVHSGEKVFECVICKAVFARKDSLIKHVEIH